MSDATPRVTPAVDALRIAEEELGHRFTRRLRIFAFQQLRDSALAEDVAQETLHRVIEALRANRLDNPEALPAFVYQTARNICMHRVRSMLRERSAFARLERGATEAWEADPLAGLVSGERAAEVRAALDALSAADRELLSLAYYEELDAEGVAERLGITPAAARVRKHRALRRLAELLGRGNESSTPGTPTR